ncbi:MAG: IS3 family transposase [Gemmatimonadetes bacterium]|nr:IS3 family transposase [Gemmatimonadota bacterium]
MSKVKQRGSRQARRTFSPEFKLEAVRLMRERRAAGVSVAQVGRELGVRPDMLRRWARQVDGGPGASGRAGFPGNGQLPGAEAEMRRLQRENAVLRQEREFPKKSGGVLRERVAVKYACIARHRGEFPVRLMCRVLSVSVSGFYAAQRREPSARAQRDQVLRLRVRAVHRWSRRRYGAPRVHRELVTRGTRVGKKRVARLMREDGLVGRRPRRFVRTTQARAGDPVAPNRLARQFGVDQVPGPNRVWVSDLTYVPTREGWLFLAIVLDLASRRIVGWAMRETLEEDLALAALRMALADRRPSPGLLHHSDRGSQYTGGAYQALLAAHGLVASMSKKGDCWDNAVAESFFATLEVELLLEADWPTRAAARQAIFAYLETWYNRERRHSSLGYRSPVQYEAEVLNRRVAA